MKNTKVKFLVSLLLIIALMGSIITTTVKATEVEVPEEDANQDIAAQAEGEEEEETTWTDFSNATFELKRHGFHDARLEILNVEKNTDSMYKILITSNADKPNVEDFETKGCSLMYDNNKFSVVDSNYEVTDAVEKAGDIYVSILEMKTQDNKNIVMYGKKIERYEEDKYTNAFSATFLTSETDQIVTSFTHNRDTERKIQIKIGLITDTSILKKIQNKDASAFSTLQNYAKSNNGIYDKTSSIKSAWIEYLAGGVYSDTNNEVIKLNNLQNGAYYYLYVKSDDENGKYTSHEAVTLAQASVGSEGWAMFFYGTEDFKWADFGEDDGDKKDDTVVPAPKLPQTGTRDMITIAILGGVLAVIAYTYRRDKKMRDIK